MRYYSAVIPLWVIFCHIFRVFAKSQRCIVMELSALKPGSQLCIIPSNLRYLVLVKISLFHYPAA